MAKECAQRAGISSPCGGRPGRILKRVRVYLNADKTKWLDVATGLVKHKPRIRKNIVGNRYGCLVVIELHALSSRNHAGTVWLCQCDCGRTKLVTVTALNTGTTKSCGCLHAATLNRNKLKLIERSMKPTGEAAFMWLLRSYVSSAKERCVEFALTNDEFRQLTKEDCFYCGTEPRQLVKAKYKNLNGNYLHNGIDRLDSSDGYVSSNCVACCITCNRAKNVLSLDCFCDWIERLTSYRKTVSIRQSIDELNKLRSLWQ